MALYLVRHGETDFNRAKRFQSRTDVPLNARGLAQARAVRAELLRRGVSFVLAKSSPLSRAVATARIILEGATTPLEIEPAFIELDFGGFEGRLEDELKQELGERYAQWRASEYTAPPPLGGESIITGAERVRAALLALQPAAVQGDVLIVAHQAVNMALKVVLSGRSDVASAASYRQDNNQVDVWEIATGERLDLFTVNPAVDEELGATP